MQTISRVILAAACAAALSGTATAAQQSTTHHDTPRYRITILSSLGGNNSRANSIDDLGIIGGYSKPAGNAVRHASVWAYGQQLDLGTLGGPNFNSSVAWPVKNNVFLISGISETGAVNPLGETWSCGAFFATSGNICYGFVKSLLGGPMLPLYPLAGGLNSYATGTNDFGRTVGWAENGYHDPECAPDSDQVLQFKPVYWNFGAGHQPHELPLLSGDTSGAATAINDRGQIVGISGSCDQSVGRATARHAVMWSNGHVADLGNIGGDLWNTPGAINENGDVVGFAGTQPGDTAGDFTRAFAKFRNRPMQDLGVLYPADFSSTATGINARRQIVGYSTDGPNTRAFLWQDGRMMDLKMLAPDFDGQLVLANDIDDFGRIVGRGVDPVTGFIVAFLATPVGR
jgi:probable HAF family extracellular repeat protein